MQIVEPSPDDIVCPFCQKTVCQSVERAEETGWVFDPKTEVCEHTLFVATSEETFEYRSERFNQHMNLPNDDDWWPKLPPPPDDPGGRMSLDEFTSCVDIPGAIKFTSGDLHIAVYVGFAP